MSYRFALAVPVHLAAAAVMCGQISTNFPDTVSPGQTLDITGLGTGDTVTVGIHSNSGVKAGDQQVTGTVAGGVFKLSLPAKLSPGRYFLTLIEKGDAGKVVKDETLPGEIRVPNDPVKLDSTHPTTAYRNSVTNRFDFAVIGEGFSQVKEDNQVYIAGQGPIIKTYGISETECKNKVKEDQPCLWMTQNQPQIIHVMGYERVGYQGPLNLTVQVGSAKSQPTPLVLSRMSETGVILSAVVIFAGIGWIIFRLISGGIRQNIIGGKRYSPFQAFFLDKESGSYSLSKFQFLLFSSTFVFGYLYVFLCRWLVQWQFILPDVPGNFSAILAISAGTTVAAVGATAARGSKGGGPVYPSMADFISTGGQVVPERFQFFVWSLMACSGFVALLISQNPATINGFPQFPDGLLYIMGVSSAGYLGGKLTRKPGPVIRNIVLDKSAGQKIVIQGENLSRTGDFLIDGKKLPIITKTPELQAAPELVKAKDQDGAPDKSFATELIITIDERAGVDVRTGDHTFRIVNQDGQFNEAHFTGDLPKIDTVCTGDDPPQAGQKQITHSDGPVPVQISGEGFRTGMTISWKADGATDATDLGASALKLADADPQHKATITLTPGKTGTGVLLLTTPAGFSASATVTIV